MNKIIKIKFTSWLKDRSGKNGMTKSWDDAKRIEQRTPREALPVILSLSRAFHHPKLRRGSITSIKPRQQPPQLQLLMQSKTRTSIEVHINAAIALQETLFISYNSHENLFQCRQNAIFIVNWMSTLFLNYMYKHVWYVTLCNRECN